MPHTYTAVNAHLVFATKGRREQLDAGLEERLYSYIGGVLRSLDAQLRALNGAADHLHLLIAIPATASISAIAWKVKGCTSKWIHETFPHRRNFEWQRGYAAFSVSESQVPRVIRYIERQKEHHRRVSFRDEFVRLLTHHGVQVDERYLFT